MNYSHILIIQLKHLGDILLTTPVISALKAVWPQTAISALTPLGMEAMLTEHPLLTEVLTIDRRDRNPWSFLKFTTGLRRRRFDLVLEFSGGDRGAFYAWLTGARTRVGFDHPQRPLWQRRFAFTRLAPPPPLREHTVEKNLDLVRALGVEPHHHGLEFFWNPQTEQEVQDLLHQHGLAPKNFILLHPPARWLFKCWTAEGYAQVIDALQNDYKLPVVLTAAPTSQEMQFIQDIAHRLHTSPVNLAGQSGSEGPGRHDCSGPTVYRCGQRPHAPGRRRRHPHRRPLRSLRALQLAPLGRRAHCAHQRFRLSTLRPGRLRRHQDQPLPHRHHSR